jgi:restriction system protein
MWMVRGNGGALYEDFREKSVAAIGWAKLAPHAKPGVSRKNLTELYAKAEPGFKHGSVVASASQVWRFVNEIELGDHIVTYSPANRSYLVGTVTGAAEHRPEWEDADMAIVRPVNWDTREVLRDALSSSTKNSLGSTLTVFKVPASAAKEILSVSRAASSSSVEISVDVETPESSVDIDEQAREMIKDMVARLDPREMEQLVAGILRAMGFKTRVSPVGPDRGKDIVASPDGFGFRDPRIVVEVKHRSGQMGSQALRSFIGGRHPGDRGLYVSTGGFSKDALYEAERAQVPMTLWTLDDLVRALVEHYDQTDAETKRMVPLKRVYWPA